MVIYQFQKHQIHSFTASSHAVGMVFRRHETKIMKKGGILS